MNHSLKKIWNSLTTALVAAAVLLAALLAGPRLFGLQVYTVLSGSMEPAYRTGSLIYVKKISPAEVEPGRPITFMLDAQTVATHRVVEVVPDETDPSVLRFRTKGDANEQADGALVHQNNVLGTPVLTVPGLGYVANFIQNPPGKYLAISAAALLLLMVLLPDALFGGKKKPKGQK